jgi:regulator of protease activity HflC (stomatin/prohibitin superfamily)
MDTGVFVLAFAFAIALFGLLALARGARTVRQYEKGLITRLGKYHGMAPSGLTFIVPFVDDIVRVDMREQVITVPPQKLITKDNVTVEVDAVVYYKVIDPVKSQYEVQDFGYACTTLAQTNLRNLIGDRTLDETLVARDMINTNLREVLDEATDESRPREAGCGAGSGRHQAEPDFAGGGHETVGDFAGGRRRAGAHHAGECGSRSDQAGFQCSGDVLQGARGDDAEA